MRLVYALILLSFFSVFNIHAQGTWYATTAPVVTDRYDDIYFLNTDTGWAVSLYYPPGQPGQILKTINGGVSWVAGNASSFALYRDIGFLDAQNGFTGTLLSGGDTSIMFHTTDGGSNWYPVTNIPGPRPAGICGMRVINDSTLYACGRYFGPAGFYKTTNKGASWYYNDLDSVAGGCVDAFFFDKDTGFIAGTENSNADWGSGRGVILHTTDGGNTWDKIRITDHDSEMCWKISFPSRMIGYASIESFRTVADSQFVLKTIDGGLTWKEVYYCTDAGYPLGFDAQGIGFINDTVGWVGGRDNGTSKEYKTTDGGKTWMVEGWGLNLNRFRNLGNGIAYFSGATVYKFQCGPLVNTDSISICPGTTYAIDGLIFNQTVDTILITDTSLCGTAVHLKLNNFIVQQPLVTDTSDMLSTGNYLSYQWYLNNVVVAGATSSSYLPTQNGNYTVQVADSNLCHVSSATYNITDLGIQSIAIPDFTLYPDPATDKLYISGLTDKTPVIITNVIGQQVMYNTTTGATRLIDISQLAPGLYFANHKPFVKQ